MDDPVDGQRVDGTVALFFGDRGYGFLHIQDDPLRRKIFVHFTEIVGDAGSYRELQRGDRVRFTLTQSPRGLKALQVEVLPMARNPEG